MVRPVGPKGSFPLLVRWAGSCCCSRGRFFPRRRFFAKLRGALRVWAVLGRVPGLVVQFIQPRGVVVTFCDQHSAQVFGSFRLVVAQVDPAVVCC